MKKPQWSKTLQNGPKLAQIVLGAIYREEKSQNLSLEDFDEFLGDFYFKINSAISTCVTGLSSVFPNEFVVVSFSQNQSCKRFRKRFHTSFVHKITLSYRFDVHFFSCRSFIKRRSCVQILRAFKTMKLVLDDTKLGHVGICGLFMKDWKKKQSRSLATSGNY